ncbi:MAPEG family protein [Thalassobaculum sp. OXR-137]|uniref:MAPEG family protein n=1 Tax=Thalassobaculum sp. OXR-137 TaxID=3100173 RepID=UPI002AC8A47A|nr:MAPEG family protein [Thalassobaculum sp. OXR-137]WPZ32594.1 MAPEG family protein [Thalassobaculum sp. OXR-137]
MITAAYAGLLGLIFLILTVRVVMRRGAVRATLGTGGDVLLERRIRAHGNFIEFVPLVLILMILLEMQNVSIWIVHVVGVCLVIGRVIHGANISRENESLGGRVVGMVLTMTALGVASIFALLRSFGVM